MHMYALARCFLQIEFGFGTLGLPLYPDANTLFDIEKNNRWTQVLTEDQEDLLREVNFQQKFLFCCTGAPVNV